MLSACPSSLVRNTSMESPSVIETLNYKRVLDSCREIAIPLAIRVWFETLEAASDCCFRTAALHPATRSDFAHLEEQAHGLAYFRVAWTSKSIHAADSGRFCVLRSNGYTDRRLSLVCRGTKRVPTSRASLGAYISAITSLAVPASWVRRASAPAAWPAIHPRAS